MKFRRKRRSKAPDVTTADASDVAPPHGRTHKWPDAVGIGAVATGAGIGVKEHEAVEFSLIVDGTLVYGLGTFTIHLSGPRSPSRRRPAERQSGWSDLDVDR